MPLSNQKALEHRNLIITLTATPRTLKAVLEEDLNGSLIHQCVNFAQYALFAYVTRTLVTKNIYKRPHPTNKTTPIFDQTRSPQLGRGFYIVLSQFNSGLFRSTFTMKEASGGKTTCRRVSL